MISYFWMNEHSFQSNENEIQQIIHLELIDFFKKNNHLKNLFKKNSVNNTN